MTSFVAISYSLCCLLRRALSLRRCCGGFVRRRHRYSSEVDDQGNVIKYTDMNNQDKEQLYTLMGGFDTVAFGVEALLMTTYLKRCDVWRRTGELDMNDEYRFFDIRVAADRARSWDDWDGWFSRGDREEQSSVRRLTKTGRQ